MSRQSPWDCPFCGRMSTEEPLLSPRKPQTHPVECGAKSRDGKIGVYFVVCWHCGARGPLAGSVRSAVERWRHNADRQGAPQW